MRYLLSLFILIQFGQFAFAADKFEKQLDKAIKHCQKALTPSMLQAEDARLIFELIQADHGIDLGLESIDPGQGLAELDRAEYNRIIDDSYEDDTHGLSSMFIQAYACSKFGLEDAFFSELYEHLETGSFFATNMAMVIDIIQKRGCIDADWSEMLKDELSQSLQAHLSNDIVNCPGNHDRTAALFALSLSGRTAAINRTLIQMLIFTQLEDGSFPKGTEEAKPHIMTTAYALYVLLEYKSSL